jgi:hypothetical protein
VVAHRPGQEGFTTQGREQVVLYRALGLRALSASGRAGEDFGRGVKARGLLRALASGARPRRSGSVEIRGLERFPESADRLFEESRREFDWILVRSASYLNWRYAHPSAGRYAIRGAFEGDVLTGYCVTRIGGPCAHIADLLALPGRSRVADALVVDALEIAARSGAGGVVCWLVCDHPYFDLVRRRGFVVTGSNPGCMVRNEKLEPGALAFLERPEARVHLAAGDSDWV